MFQEKTVRRSHALVGIQAFVAMIVAGLLLALLGSPASAGPGPDYLCVGAAHPSGSPCPAQPSYEDGQTIQLFLDINESDNDAVKVSLYSDKSGSYLPVAGQTGVTANTYGKYTFTYAPTGEQNVQVRLDNGGSLSPDGNPTAHLTPTAAPPPGEIAPDPAHDVGNLYETPATFANGDSITLTANFPSGTFPITLYKETAPGTWTSIGTKQSSSYGNADFTYVVNGSAKIFARKANNDQTEVDTVAPSPALNLHIQRDCTGNDCADTATAFGTLDPAVEGRPVKLEYKNGSTWTQVGTPTTSGADGKANIQFDLTGVPQWTTRTYHLVSGDASNPTITSREIQFMPGPKQLGKNVLRVDVDKGVYPTSKTAEYTGKATLSVDGTVTHDHLALENFGVRGSSTASYTKKPYKLKFLNKPDVKPFGMTKGKSWTLLASFLDQSFVREKVGLDLGRKLSPANGGGIAWTPDSRYVEMFVNDQYRGAYLMTESVKIDGSRVNVSETNGMIMEVDGASVADSSLGFLSPHNIAFAFKDPDERKTLSDGSVDPKGVTSAKLTAIKNRVTAFESKIYSSTASTRAQYPDYLDQASAIDYYLVKEFTKDNDADFYRSHYFSWDPSDPEGTITPTNPLDDNKFHFGPAWDFDRSAGNLTDTDTAAHIYTASPNGWCLRGTGTSTGRPNYKTHWFVQLFKDATFSAAVKARWADVRTKFEAAQADVAADKAAIGVGAANDRARWASEPKRYKPHTFNGTTGYDGEIAFVTDWYKKRLAYFDANM